MGGLLDWIRKNSPDSKGSTDQWSKEVLEKGLEQIFRHRSKKKVVAQCDNCNIVMYCEEWVIKEDPWCIRCGAELKYKEINGPETA